MDPIITILIIIIALQHLFFLYMEMFAWETLGKKIFKGALPKDLFTPTKGIMANQGLYNGFLVAGLIWSLIIRDDLWSQNISIFFLSCVALAGVFGGISASKKIFIVQGVPAIITLVLIWING